MPDNEQDNVRVNLLVNKDKDPALFELIKSIKSQDKRAAARRIINLATLSIYLEKLPFKQGSELNEIRPTISSVPEPLILTPITPLLMDEEEEADLRGMFGNDS